MAQHRPVQGEVRRHDRRSGLALGGVDNLHHPKAGAGDHHCISVRCPTVGIHSSRDHQMVGVVPKRGGLDAQLLVVVGHQLLVDQIAVPQDVEPCRGEVSVEPCRPTGPVIAVSDGDRIGAQSAQTVHKALPGHEEADSGLIGQLVAERRDLVGAGGAETVDPIGADLPDHLAVRLCQAHHGLFEQVEVVGPLIEAVVVVRHVQNPLEHAGARWRHLQELLGTVVEIAGRGDKTGVGPVSAVRPANGEFRCGDFSACHGVILADAEGVRHSVEPDAPRL